LTSALEGGEGSASRPGRTLHPGKTWYTLYRKLGGPQGRPGQMRKISLLNLLAAKSWKKSSKILVEHLKFWRHYKPWWDCSHPVLPKRLARVPTHTNIGIPIRTNMLFDVNGIVRFTFKPSKHRTNLPSTS